MVKFVVVAVLAVSGCVDADDAGEVCVRQPNRPGRAVAFDGDRVTMSRIDYDALLAYEQALIERWQCDGR